MATDTNVTHLVVNKMTQEQYDSATKNPNELYLTPETSTQSDWAQTDASAADYIKNKPTIPTKTSDLTNDSGFITSSDVPTKTSDLTNDSDFITSSDVDSKIAVETAARQQADNTLTQSIATESQNRQTADSGLQSGIDTINGKIPTQATTSNQLADKNFVNSSINSVTAYYITRNAAGDQFNTKAQLDSTTTFYSGGEVRVPTRNDYCIVLADETKTDPVTGENPTTRYIYQTNGWEFQYIVNKTSLTAAQLAAVNSGITSAAVTKLNGIAEGAEVNVQSDWTQTNTSADDYIKNKPTGLVTDANYVHTDNNFTTTEKNKLSGIASGAEVNVQSDWNQTSSTNDAYIKNKPTLGSLAGKNSVAVGDVTWSGFLDKIYPVGSIYMSVSHTTATQVKNALGGGTWQAWGAGRVPVGVDTTQTEFNTVNKTGGEKTHTLTENEMPKHEHGYYWRHLYWDAGMDGHFSYNADINWGGYDIQFTNNNVATQFSGNDQPHNNLQPYVTVYMWRRTA